MRCKICGVETERKSNRQIYCKECYLKIKVAKDKNRIKRKRELGTSNFFGHRKKDFDEEQKEINKEIKRIGLKRQFS